MWACNCLNIVINTESNDFQKVNVNSLNLSDEERKHPFFQQVCGFSSFYYPIAYRNFVIVQEIQQISKLTNINKVISGLVHSSNVGLWTIFYCINCDLYSYAVHREKGASCVLINSNLLVRSDFDSHRN